MRQYSTERICIAIVDMSTIQCALYCKLGANTAHNFQLTQCELRSRTYTMHLQLCLFRLQYSSERISAAIGDISTIQCALYCNLWAKYSAHPPDYAIWIEIPAIYSVITAPDIQTSIFNKTYFCHYWSYLVNWMSVIIHTRCQIQRTTTSLRNVNCGPGHIQCTYSSAYSEFNIPQNVAPLL
jgi:hypothetical protein